MGPALIFDKSALEGLNPDEAMWLDNFYLANITPLFFVETLADLEKKIRINRTPEQIVGNLANKTPENGCVNAHHADLLQGELTGQGVIEMKGRPAITEGQTVKLGNETGIIFLPSPEEEAFQRWQKHEFLDIERTIAKKWRKGLKSSASSESHEIFQSIFGSFVKPNTLDEVMEQINEVIDSPQRKDVLIFGLSVLGVSPEAQDSIVKRWESAGQKTIREFAPYFVHILSVDLLFYCGTAANLFSGFRHPQTHMIDIAYLYYLPFCDVFVSNDKIHIGLAPFFLRTNQVFIEGTALKTELAKLDQLYSGYPEDVKNRGVMTFAMIPPDDTSFFTTRMWDKFISSTWRDIKSKKFDGTDVVDAEAERALTEKINSFVKRAEPIDREVLTSSDGADQMIRTRMVSAKRGKWNRFPPEVLNSKKRIL